MLYIQVLVNGLVLGGLYSCIGVGFSLVWGVLNIINLLHGSLIILGSYTAFFAHQYFHVNPFLFAPVAAALLFCLGYVTQLAQPRDGEPRADHADADLWAQSSSL